MPNRGELITLDAYFEDLEPESRALFKSVDALIATLGDVEVRPTKSQIAFRRRINFAWAWNSGQYLEGDFPPLVLTVGLRRRDESPRWKQVVEPSPGRFVHHLELYSAERLDDEVLGWLREAWELAG